MRSHPIAVNRYSKAVWRRNFTVWRKLMWPSLTTNVLDPLIFLFAFGYGLGAVVEQIGGLDYLTFVVPGMMCYAAMFAASFESTISTYARFSLQRTWDAILATPVTLTELMLGEMLWAATKGMFSAAASSSSVRCGAGSESRRRAAGAAGAGAGCVCFASCGLVTTAHAKTWDIFAYYFTFWVTPMFVFSGTFFEVTRFPWFVQAIAWVLPMTHLIAVVRPLTAGVALDPLAAAGASRLCRGARGRGVRAGAPPLRTAAVRLKIPGSAAARIVLDFPPAELRPRGREDRWALFFGTSSVVGAGFSPPVVQPESRRKGTTSSNRHETGETASHGAVVGRAKARPLSVGGDVALGLEGRKPLRSRRDRPAPWASPVA